MDGLVERSFWWYAVLVLVTVLLPRARARAAAGAGLGGVALGVAAGRVGGPGGDPTFTIINECLIALGTAVVAGAAIVAWRRHHAEPADSSVPDPGAKPEALLLGGLLLCATGPHLMLVASGTFLVLLSGARPALRQRRSVWLVLIASAAASLATAFYLLFTILGPAGGSMGLLGTGPFSAPAERLLVMLLGLGSLPLAGVFPFHGAPWRRSLAPLAAILLARVIVPAFPEGLRDWQAAVLLWLLIALALASFTGRWPVAVVAGGLISLWGGADHGVFPGCVLLLGGWLLDAGLIRDRRLARVAAAIVALVVPFALVAALGAQVLLPVLAVLSVILGLARGAWRRAAVS